MANMGRRHRDFTLLTVALACVHMAALIDGFPIDSEITGSLLPELGIVTAGDSAQLRCITPESGYLFQYWRHPHPNIAEIRESVEGKFILNNLENTHRYELNLNDATQEDGGTYMCVFTNAGSGELVAQSLILTYRDPVHFLTSNGLVYRVLAGSNASISCLADNYESIQWQNHKSDVITAMYSERVYTTEIDGGILLVIMSALLQDNGTYYCFANNEITPNVHIQAFLNVYIQPTVTVIPSMATVKEFRNVSFTCNASGFPKLSVEWYRKLPNLSLLTSNIKVQESQHTVMSVLHLDSVAITDAGDYYCLAFNPYGSDNASTTLTITPNCRTLPANVQAHLTEHHSINITWLPPVCENSLTEDYMLTIQWWIVCNNTWSRVIEDPFKTTHYTITDVNTQTTYFIRVSAGGNTSDVITVITGHESAGNNMLTCSCSEKNIGFISGSLIGGIAIGCAIVFIPMTLYILYLRKTFTETLKESKNQSTTPKSMASSKVEAVPVYDTVSELKAAETIPQSLDESSNIHYEVTKPTEEAVYEEAK